MEPSSPPVSRLPREPRPAVPAPICVAIVGGSGAGKSWLAQRLVEGLGGAATVLCLDRFYHDRSHLTPARRARVNYDHPRAIDFHAFRAALERLRRGRPAPIPRYDYVSHCRFPGVEVVPARRVILVEGLWLLRTAAWRRGFDLRVFVACTAAERLRRRLARDRHQRGRNRVETRRRFRGQVEPMHRRFVEPQRNHADLILESPVDLASVRGLLQAIRDRLAAS